MASLLADSWRHNPKMKTMTTPASAKTRGSGNQRSLQVAKASPKRAKPLSRATKFLARWDGIGFDGIDPPLLACIRLPWDYGDRAPLPRLSPNFTGNRKTGESTSLAASSPRGVTKRKFGRGPFGLRSGQALKVRSSRTHFTQARTARPSVFC